MKKLSLLLVVVLVLVAVFVPATRAQEPKTLTVGTTDDIAKLDPADAYSFHDWELWRNVGEGLLGFTPGDVTLEPRLATDFPVVSEDGLTYTFTVRDDAMFPDGTVVTADDVVAAVTRSLTVQGDPFGLVSVITEVVADGSNVVFTLSAPFDLFPVITALPPTFPTYPGDFPEAEANNQPERLWGPGAYQMTEYTIGETAVLEKNPNYYGEAGDYDRVVFVYYEEAAQLDAAIEAGDIDISWRSNSPEQIETLDALEQLEVQTVPDGIRYLILNHNLMTDENINKGIATAVNRDEIIDRALNGYGAPLYSMIPPGFLGANEAFLDTYGFGDAEAARALFEAAGFSEDNKYVMDLWYPPNRYAGAGEFVMQVLEEQLEATGVVEVNIQSAEWSTYIVAATSGEYPVFFLGWFFDYPDSDNYIHPFASTEGSPGLGVNFSNADVDALIAKERSEVADPETRTETFAELQQAYADNVVTIPLFYVENYLIFDNTKVGSVVLGTPLILEYRLVKAAG